VQRISEPIGRHLGRKGLLVRDVESTYLALDAGGEDDALAELQGHSITYRIALGTHKARKAFMLQSLPRCGERSGSDRVAQAAGFSLHAGVAAEADQRGKLERLCRSIARPAVAIERLSLTAQGHIRYALKTPYETVLHTLAPTDSGAHRARFRRTPWLTEGQLRFQPPVRFSSRQSECYRH
jgi:hypothetical protein